jgi:hypothetical protein
MATLTYDPTDPEAPELNQEEQESLAIGEQAEADQQALLAGKFKDAESLEQAYIELQKKLGSNEPEPEAEPEGVRDEEPETQEVEKTEEEEDETPEEDVVFTEQDVERIHNIVGGPEEYNNMLKWAAQAMTKDDIDAFDHVIGLNDPQAAAFAVFALNKFYKDQQDSEGELLTGGKATQVEDVFKSQAQVVQAMSDPKYDRDPAYRQEVMEKLERSNIKY